MSELGYKVTGERPHDIDNCPRAIITQKFAEKNFEIINSDINLENDNNKSTTKQMLDWEDYYHGEIKVPEKTWEALRILDRLIKSPLLPKKCINYLSKIKRTLHKKLC